jgi:hypothetical protein
MVILRILPVVIASIVGIFILLQFSPLGLTHGKAEILDASSVTFIREGNDFATLILGDPWDMDKFTNVSQSLNESGRLNFLQNIKVENGIFSARSTDINYAQFYLLFPGYFFTGVNGKIGELYPIPSSKYRCLYMRMRVDSQNDQDLWYASFSNNLREKSDREEGQLAGRPVHTPDLPKGSWQIYEVDLANRNNIYFNIPWSERIAWEGLRIHPTNTPNTFFEVDWVRLTDCSPVNHTISWRPFQDQTRLWAGIGGQTKDIFISSLASNESNYVWDVQGIAPGHYFIGIESSSGNVNWLPEQLLINKAPVSSFRRPSPYSGPDYASQAGNPWNMNSGQDIQRVDCSAWSISDGVLKLNTPYPAALTQGCRGGIGEADPKIFFNTYGGIDGKSYRYLSFYAYHDGEVQQVADGMIGRLFWEDRDTGCVHVGQEIPYDVGWHLYTIDMHHLINGLPVDSVGNGNCVKKLWSETSNLVPYRFDPNENWTGNLVPPRDFKQQFDWFRITKLDEVRQGYSFPIEIYVNKPVEQILSLEFYYTTDRAVPTQKRADTYPTSPGMSLSNRVYLPFVGSGFQEPQYVLPPVENAIVYYWDTRSVNPGQYYICTVADDGYNQTTFCSKAPVNVIPAQ